ncbi:hypothetical protein FSP39_014845 [Pinctada imbricata]|uniref:Plastin-2 n=1 Tax=Pinctada imbricata TaxID=66713 RepID=A0AA88YRD0_PINIB|nr:hypothetical protein FSP39_014845 [Pinctada imbricata]
MSSRVSQELSQDALDELQQAFQTIDVDSNGYIEADELQEALQLAGCKIAAYQARVIMQQYDTKHKDGKLEFDEFRAIYSDLQNKEVARTFKKAVTARKGVEVHGGTSEASVEGTTHTVRDEESKSFTEWINKTLEADDDCKAYLPMRPDSNDLYEKIKDGIVLCKLINKSVPDTIDERTINKTKLSVYRQTENHNLALNSAQSIGCNIVNIGPDDLMKGKPHLVLGLVWQVIRIGLLSDINIAMHPGLVALLQGDETIEDLKRLSPEEILIRWVNYHLERSGTDRRIKNFTSDIQDSEAYSYLLEQIAPRESGVNSGVPLSESDLTQRAEKMLQEAEKIDCRAFVSPGDVVKGNYKLNMAFVANLFNTYPALDANTEILEDIVEETREEKTYRNWMNSMGVQPYVHYLYSDLNDGLVIFKLYDIIQPGCVDWRRVHTRFNKMKENFEKLENCNYCVELGKQQKFSLVGVGGQDIRDSNPTLTLALVWQLMRAYTLSILKKLSDEDRQITDADIINWANAKLKECGKKSSFTSFQDKTLSDGRTVIDLIDSVKVGCINYDIVKDASSEEDRLSNAKYAISMARKAGAKVYALPEDIVDVKPKMMMTIFACLMIKDLGSQQKQNGE